MDKPVRRTSGDNRLLGARERGFAAQEGVEQMRIHSDIANNRLAVLLHAARNGKAGAGVQDPDEPSPRDVEWLLRRYRWEYGMLLDELDRLALWREKMMKSVRR